MGQIKNIPALVQKMAWHQPSHKQLSQPSLLTHININQPQWVKCTGTMGTIKKLEKLEHLCSEDTPAASWLPKLLSHIGSQVKIRQSQSYKFKEFAKISKFWNKPYTWHTFWSGLIRCANMKWIRWVLLKIQSGHDSVHRWTDGQRDKMKPVYPPFDFVEVGGIKTWIMLLWHLSFHSWSTFQHWLKLRHVDWWQMACYQMASNHFTWVMSDLMTIWLLGANFSEIFTKIQ